MKITKNKNETGINKYTASNSVMSTNGFSRKMPGNGNGEMPTQWWHVIMMR